VDGQRFDDVARALATGSSRRRLLAGAAGSAIGALLALVGLAPAGAKGCVDTGRRCHRTKPCCGGGFCGPDGMCQPCLAIGEEVSGQCGLETVAQCCVHDVPRGPISVCLIERNICCATILLPCVQDTDCCNYPAEVCRGGLCIAPAGAGATVHAAGVHVARA